MRARGRRGAAAVLAGALVLASAACSTPDPDPGPAPVTSSASSAPGAAGSAGVPAPGAGTGAGTSATDAPAPAVTSPLRVVNAWAIPSRNGQSRVYLTLMNPGFSEIEVTGVTTTAGGTAQLRATPDDATAAEAIRVEAGQSVVFDAAGPFIFVTGLTTPMREGDRVVVTLETSTGDTTRFSAFARTTAPQS